MKMKNVLKIKYLLIFALVISSLSLYTFLNNNPETKSITQTESIEERDILVLSASTTPLIIETNVANPTITKEDILSWIKDYVTLSKTEEYNRETPPTPVYNTYITRSGGSPDGLANAVGRSVATINNDIDNLLTSPSISGDAYFGGDVVVGTTTAVADFAVGGTAYIGDNSEYYDEEDPFGDGDGGMHTQLVVIHKSTRTDDNIHDARIGIEQSLIVQPEGNITTTPDYFGIMSSTGFNGTEGHGTIYGLESAVALWGTEGSALNYGNTGAYGYATGIHSYPLAMDANVDRLYSFDSSLEIYTNSFPTSIKTYVDYNSGSYIYGATIDKYYDFRAQGIDPSYLSDYSESGSSIDEMYGVYIGPHTQGVTKSYNLYSEGATTKNYFEGLVGVGTTTPSAKVSITQSADSAVGGLWLTTSNNTDFRSAYMNTSGVLSFYGGDTAGALNTATLNSAGAWTNASDISYKENIENLSDKYTLEDLMKIQPRFYTMKGTNLPQIGFIAQELELIIPEVVDGVDGSKGISYGNLVAMVISALQELNLKVEKVFKWFVGDRFEVQGDICVNNTCITKDQFEIMILKSGVGAVQTYTAPPILPEIEISSSTPDEIIEDKATTTIEILENDETTTEATSTPFETQEDEGTME